MDEVVSDVTPSVTQDTGFFIDALQCTAAVEEEDGPVIRGSAHFTPLLIYYFRCLIRTFALAWLASDDILSAAHEPLLW